MSTGKWHYRQRKMIFEFLMHIIAHADADETCFGMIFVRSRCRHSCSLRFRGARIADEVYFGNNWFGGFQRGILWGGASQQLGSCAHRLQSLIFEFLCEISLFHPIKLCLWDVQSKAKCTASQPQSLAIFWTAGEIARNFHSKTPRNRNRIVAAEKSQPIPRKNRCVQFDRVNESQASTANHRRETVHLGPKGFDATLLVATGARTTPILRFPLPLAKPPLETPDWYFIADTGAEKISFGSTSAMILDNEQLNRALENRRVSLGSLRQSAPNWECSNDPWP